MSPAEREQLIAMSPAGRISHYLKKKIAGTITAEKYEKCIEYALSLPYSSPKETPGEVRTDDGQPEAHNDREAGRDDYRTQTGETPSQEPATAPMERDDSVSLPRDTDGNTHESGGMHPNIDKGQSQKKRILTLLSDYKPHTSVEIMEKCYFIEERQGGFCNYKARIDELRNEGWDIPRAEKVKGTLHSYTLKGRKTISPFYGG